MSSSLPTTPVGKQQLIDMRAGAILRGHARKSERYLGCPVRLLLTFIVLIKSSMLCAWLVREIVLQIVGNYYNPQLLEYYFFDLRCSFISTSLGDEILKRRSLEVLRIPVFASDPPAVNYFDEEHHHRVKRTLESFGSDPRMKPRRERKKSFANLQGVPTTVVTLTNTQLLPVDGDTLRMKTIRNRVEPMSDVSADDDVVEIDIDAPPRVYISKIMSRGAPFQLSTFSSSATCIARTMFDLWCVCQLMTLFPYLIGVCVARRSLFVSHLVLDILLLVIGFVYT
ncbi:hypothetical protein ANCCEY_14290 [Ancylostoma ceylanicum]|uniref:Uncharacterized protein n=1 Tax=Ancylostoma ceylanicum TaxID=53326 RepID=A0A0D6L5B3_9BILA|nr:hypothetical protein ANCCEY_14290 [Ancylostoma ceylanicum]